MRFSRWPRPPTATLFPYTTLFRSRYERDRRLRERSPDRREDAPDDTLRQAEALARRSEEHTSELQSLTKLVCRLLLEKKKQPSALVASRTRDGAGRIAHPRAQLPA